MLFSSNNLLVNKSHAKITQVTLHSTCAHVYGSRYCVCERKTVSSRVDGSLTEPHRYYYYALERDRPPPQRPTSLFSPFVHANSSSSRRLVRFCLVLPVAIGNFRAYVSLDLTISIGCLEFEHTGRISHSLVYHRDH